MKDVVTVEAVKHPVLGEARLLELACKLAAAGARRQVVTSLTGLGVKRIRQIFRSLPSVEFAHGPIQFPQPKHFAAISTKVNPSVNLHSASLLAKHATLKEEFNKYLGPVHEGSLLLTAFNAYKKGLEWHGLDDHGEIDINKAYILTRYHGTDLQLARCGQCGTRIVVLRWFDKGNQRCPICAKSSFMEHMTQVKKLTSRQSKLDFAS